MDKIMNWRYGAERNYINYYEDFYKNPRLRRDLQRAITKMIEIADHNQIPFMFANIPEFHLHHNQFSRVNEFLKEEVLKGHRLVYLDLSPRFQNVSTDPAELWVSYEDHHPNARAHRMIAENVYRELPPDFIHG